MPRQQGQSATNAAARICLARRADTLAPAAAPWGRFRA